MFANLKRKKSKKANPEHLLEEWKMLREEVASKQDFASRLALTIVAGNLAIYSFASALQSLAPWNALVALLPVFLTTTAYFWYLKDLSSAQRIFLYCKEIEKNTGLGWETWVQKRREGTQPAGKITPRTCVFCLLYHSFLGISWLVCVILMIAPHLSFTSSSSAGSTGMAQAPATVWATGIILVTVFCLGWYWLAGRIWINSKLNSIMKMNGYSW